MTDYADLPQPAPRGEPVAEPAKPKKLEKEHILTLENHFLKIANLKLQGEKLQDDSRRCGEMMRAEQDRLRAYRDTLSKELGVDLEKCQVLPDGTIVPTLTGFPTQQG